MGGGIGKRKQGEIVADFLVSILPAATQALLSDGSIVADVAGGCGHVSLALALRGVKSTVIDPRPTAGKLPSRDRNALLRAFGSSRPPVPFSTQRAWFGSRPEG